MPSVTFFQDEDLKISGTWEREGGVYANICMANTLQGGTAAGASGVSE